LLYSSCMADDVSEVKTRFQGRVAIITGGGSGLGRLLAHRFAAEGASVVVADLRNASAVAAEISEAGGLSLARTTDVTSAADVKAMVEVARESFGPVDDLHGLRLSVPYLAGVGLQPGLLGFILDIVRLLFGGFQGSGPLFLGVELPIAC
jgi:NAD(P)-dependent dehydrogenase (short-subunit alcohol dehydrogenase family)